MENDKAKKENKKKEELDTAMVKPFSLKKFAKLSEKIETDEENAD